MNPLTELPLALACAVTLAAAWMDARTGRIPNLLTLPVLPVALLLGALDGGLWGVGFAVLGGLVCVAVPYGLFRASQGVAIGGGDVKLFAALGALLGPLAGLEVQLASLLVLSACALLMLAWRGELLAWWRHTARFAFHWLSARASAAQRGAAPHSPAVDPLLAMRLGPAVCFATWSLALLQHLPARLFL